jgi:hypothetical protein
MKAKRTKRRTLRKAVRVGIPLGVIAILLLTGTALASNSGTLTLEWYVIGGGGGHSAALPYTLDGTVGQAVVGTIILAGPYDHCAGFWCWAWDFERKNMYLPLVLRNA